MANASTSIQTTEPTRRDFLFLATGAVGAVAGPPHLTGPLPSGVDLLAALAPDVIVTLDDQALERCQQLPGLPRATTIVACSGQADGLSMVPWTIGSASGRLRARIGTDVEAAAVADLARRLAAGPPPVAPAVSWVQDEVVDGIARRRASGSGPVVVAPSDADEAPS